MRYSIFPLLCAVSCESGMSAMNNGAAGLDGGIAAGGDGSAGAGGSAQLGPNLISNGDFSSGQTGWMLAPPGHGTATASVMNGQICLTLSGTGSDPTTLGWSAGLAQGVALAAGATYQFSFDIVSQPALLSFENKIASTSPPHAVDFDDTGDSLTGVLQTFVHTFASTGDPSAGVAFVFDTGGFSEMACIGNVSLRQLQSAM
jgi:endoglucanase